LKGPVGFAKKIRQEGGTVFELDTGHDAMITEPKKLAMTLDKIASAPVARRARIGQDPLAQSFGAVEVFRPPLSF
jgi:hypothetical protein